MPSLHPKITATTGAEITPDIIDMTIQALADTWEGEEAEHGISAFLYKTETPLDALRFPRAQVIAGELSLNCNRISYFVFFAQRLK